MSMNKSLVWKAEPSSFFGTWAQETFVVSAINAHYVIPYFRFGLMSPLECKFQKSEHYLSPDMAYTLNIHSTNNATYLSSASKP